MSGMSFQSCHCGWSKVTTYHGLRTHQGKKGCTPKGMNIPQYEQFIYPTQRPTYTYMGPPIHIEEPLLDTYTPFNAELLFSGLRVQDVTGNTRKQESESYIFGNDLQRNDSPPVSGSAAVKKENVPALPDLSQTDPAVLNAIKTLFTFQQTSLQMAPKSQQALDSSSGAQPLQSPASQDLSTWMIPAGAALKETNRSLFESPQRPQQRSAGLDKARRALDFSTGAQQSPNWSGDSNHSVDQQVHLPPTETKTAQTKAEEKEKEAQKQLKARQDRTRAQLQQKTQLIEQNVMEVRSSLKACKGSLDAEWLEINNVFSEVTRLVEDARRKALGPLEERRERVKKEAHYLVRKLQREMDLLKKTMDDLDKNPDLQVSSLTSLDESRQWKNLTVDTLFSFGSLRTTTSVMLEQIQEKLENLSSVELKRIPTFAVDVKLDPSSANRRLVVSPDGKTVSDGGTNQPAPDSPKSFDVFGSVVALDQLPAGKSYWEVEVRGKTGWDLGVARGDANRKGKLSFGPDAGYWVAVHYEGKKYAALTAPPVPLTLKEKPQKVGVFVDYEEGLVSFYDVTARSHIYSFTGCSFGGEIFPYFSPHLKQNEQNQAPLIISVVQKQQ